MNKQKRVFVKPCKGKRIRDIQGRVIPDSGKEVVFDTYWQRRVKAGDAIITKAEKKETKPNSGK